MKEDQSRKTKNKSSVNIWKWAFLTLVSLITIGFVLLFRALQPVSIEDNQVNAPISLEEEVSLVSSITTQDAETILNTSIETMGTDEQLSYEVKLDDQLEIQSSVELFNLTIPYSLYFDPYVTEEGNLQLRTDSIELANFSLPISAVLSLLAGGLDLPPYIGVDSEAGLILIDFNELSAEFNVRVMMKKVDLENDDIQLKLSVNQATLIEAINFEDTSLIESE